MESDAIISSRNIIPDKACQTDHLVSAKYK